MLAYVIVAHSEFDNLKELIRSIYHKDNLYCICTDLDKLPEASSNLRDLLWNDNVILRGSNRGAWGIVLEGYIEGIEACLDFSSRWEYLLFLSGSDVPLASQDKICDVIKAWFHRKIVFDAIEQRSDGFADATSTDLIMSDPFLEGKSRNINTIINPFRRDRQTYRRGGSRYVSKAGAIRGGWTGESHYLVLLNDQRLNNEGDVYSIPLSQMSRRSINSVVGSAPMMLGSVYGILPRDFCEYCVYSPRAAILFAAVKNSFAAEEMFFATLAVDDQFKHRFCRAEITFRQMEVDRRLTMGEFRAVLEQSTRGKSHGGNFPETPPLMFARKVPGPPAGPKFIEEARNLAGIEAPTEFWESQAQPPHAEAGDLMSKLSSLLALGGASANFGAVCERPFFDVKFEDNNELSYDYLHPNPIGREWVWETDGLVTRYGSDDRYALFESFRIAEDHFLCFGSWIHHPILLALKFRLSDVRPREADLGIRHEDLSATATPFNHGPSVWEVWSNCERTAHVVFTPEGDILSDGRATGWWRQDVSGLWAVGLGGMPIAHFAPDAMTRSGRHLSGRIWGRTAPEEHCILRRT